MTSVRDADRKRNDYVGADLRDLPLRIDEFRTRGDVVFGDLHDLLEVPNRSGMSMDVPTYAVLSYDACAAAFRDADTFSSSIYDVRKTTSAEAGGLGVSILTMDEPEHHRYRALAQPAFAARAMDSWEHRWLSPTLDALVAELPAKGKADLYTDYCAKFPVRTIVGGFGIDAKDAEQFHVWVLQSGGGGTPEQAAVAAKNFDDYLLGIIDDRRERETDDLIGLLANSVVVDEDGSHTLTNDEILGFARLMIVAGAGTTYRTFGFLMLQLAKHPELYERARQDRSFVLPLVEETLRWNPPVTHFMRRVVVDTELAGVEIPAGSLAQLAVGAANRDPSRWDRPHEWDPDRPMQAHLGFGFGPHFCIGNQLARMELRVALERLLDRYSSIVLDPDEPEPEIDGLLFRFLDVLPVILTSDS